MDYIEDKEKTIDDYSAIKNICAFIRKSSRVEDDKDKDIIKEKVLYLNEYYTEIYNRENPKYIRTKCLIENSIRKGIQKEPIGVMLEFLNNIDIYSFKKISFIIFYMKYYDKKLDLSIKKYFNILSKLNILCGEFKRFVILYLIFTQNSIDIDILEYMILSDVEKKSIIYLLTKDMTPFRDIEYSTSLIRMIKSIENYMLLSETTIYDDDMLKRIVKLKSTAMRISKPIGCDDVFCKMVDNKIIYYKKNNVTKRDIASSRKFNFSSTLVQNTVFIRSKLDRWYIEVDKEAKESVLFHGNDGVEDSYHYQKTFNHVNLYKIFKYIKEHDEYCLNRCKKVKA